MPCEKHGPRASVTTKTSAFGLGFCLLSPSGHVFHMASETMIKSYNIPSLVQIMAWRRPGDKPLSEPMMVSLLTYICITLPQWVNSSTAGNEWVHNQYCGYWCPGAKAPAIIVRQQSWYWASYIQNVAFTLNNIRNWYNIQVNFYWLLHKH